MSDGYSCEQLPLWIEPNVPFLVQSSANVLLVDFYYWTEPGTVADNLGRMRFEEVREYRFGDLHEWDKARLPATPEEQGQCVFEYEHSDMLERARAAGAESPHHWAIYAGDDCLDVCSGPWSMRELSDAESARSREVLEWLRDGADRLDSRYRGSRPVASVTLDRERDSEC